MEPHLPLPPSSWQKWRQSSDTGHTPYTVPKYHQLSNHTGTTVPAPQQTILACNLYIHKFTEHSWLHTWACVVDVAGDEGPSSLGAPGVTHRGDEGAWPSSLLPEHAMMTRSRLTARLRATAAREPAEYLQQQRGK